MSPSTAQTNLLSRPEVTTVCQGSAGTEAHAAGAAELTDDLWMNGDFMLTHSTLLFYSDLSNSQTSRPSETILSDLPCSLSRGGGAVRGTEPPHTFPGSLPRHSGGLLPHSVASLRHPQSITRGSQIRGYTDNSRCHDKAINYAMNCWKRLPPLPVGYKAVLRSPVNGL